MKDHKKHYFLLNNIWYILKITAQHKPRLLICTFVIIPFSLAISLLANYMTSEAVRLVTECSVTADYMAYVKYICGLGIFILTIRIGQIILSVSMEQDGLSFRFRFSQSLIANAMTLDYEYLESSEGQNKIVKAIDGIGVGGAGVQVVMGQMAEFMIGLVGLVTYSAIVCTLSPWIMILLFTLALVNVFIGKSYEEYTHSLKDEWAYSGRKLSYLHNIAKNFYYAKDIRIYDMGQWFDVLFHRNLDARRLVHIKQENALVFSGVLRALLGFVRNGAAYGVLIWKILEGGMGTAEFVWYFAIITQYAEYLYKMTNSWEKLYQQSLYFSDTRELLAMSGHSMRVGNMSVPQQTVSIEFRNVSFRYPNAEKYTLQNVSFRIEKGQKFSLLSVVFQDIAVLPTTVEKNITIEEHTSDKRKLEQAVSLSGLAEKIAALPEGLDTPLVKSVEDKAIDFSGGEMQKLALARALYKGGKVLVLDEPTAALDPIAENEMYQTYHRLTMENTSVFISHRLSSTGFCDKILLLEAGEIKERGTHQELLANGGLYAEMFEAQSKYYKEGAGERDEV